MRTRQAQALLVQTDSLTSMVANLTTAPISRAYTPYGYVPTRERAHRVFKKRVTK